MHNTNRHTNRLLPEATRLGKFVIAHGSAEFCEATPIGLVESKESFYGPSPAYRLGMSMRHVIFIVFPPNEQRGGGAALPDFLLCSLCSVQQTIIRAGLATV